jgi:probable rRNA maturation factor
MPVVYLSPWRVDVEWRPGVERLMPASRLAQAVTRALDAAGATGPASVGLVLSGDRELAALNESHMGESGPTDVLSFPLLTPGFALPPGRRAHVGDIVVSVERAIRQAEQGHGGQTGDVRWSPSDELLLLVTHGALHLCGLDHAAPDEEAAMRALEQSLLEASTPGPPSSWRSGVYP